MDGQTGASEIKIRANSQEGKTVTFKLTKLTDKATRLSIRVGTFGDEAKSQAILDEVRKKL